MLLIAALAPAPAPEQEFVTGLVVWMFGLIAISIAGLAGFATGALYALVPSPARDIWMALAIGAGVAVVGCLFSPVSLGRFLVLIVPAAAILSALCAWLVRRLTSRTTRPD